MRNTQQGRGRSAEGPTEIPARGWWDILKRTMSEVSDDRVLMVAAGVTFYLLLALAPTVAAFVSVYGLFFDPETIQQQIEPLRGILPGSALDILEDQLSLVAGADQGAIGFAFILSLGLALWSANAGMKSLFEAMNVAYDETEDRGFVKLTLVTLAMTVTMLASIIVLIAFNLAFNGLAALTGLDRLPSWVVNTVTAVVALLALITFMAALYRFGPSRESPQWSWITPGAVIAGIGVVAVSVAFSFYVSNFGTYNETYGSLGAVVGFLTWLWLVIVVLILGAEINSEMEHQTARDTTTGAARPMGARGAVKADELGGVPGKDPTMADRRPGSGDRSRHAPETRHGFARAALLFSAAGLLALARDNRG